MSCMLYSIIPWFFCFDLGLLIALMFFSENPRLQYLIKNIGNKVAFVSIALTFLMFISSPSFIADCFYTNILPLVLILIAIFFVFVTYAKRLEECDNLKAVLVGDTSMLGILKEQFSEPSIPEGGFVCIYYDVNRKRIKGGTNKYTWVQSIRLKSKDLNVLIDGVGSPRIGGTAGDYEVDAAPVFDNEEAFCDFLALFYKYYFDLFFQDAGLSCSGGDPEYITSVIINILLDRVTFNPSGIPREFSNRCQYRLLSMSQRCIYKATETFGDRIEFDVSEKNLYAERIRKVSDKIDDKIEKAGDTCSK